MALPAALYAASIILIGIAARALGAPAQWHCASFFRNGRTLCDAVLSAASQSCSSALLVSNYSASSALPRSGNGRLILDHVSSPLIATHGALWEGSGAAVRSLLAAEQPFDAILTGFAYYAQYATEESWTSAVPAVICPDLDAVRAPASVLASYLKNETLVAGWLDAIDANCKLAMTLFKDPLSYRELIRQAISMMRSSRRFRSPQVMAYRTTMPHYKHSPQRRGLDLYPAIRLEAFRVVPNLLNMAAALVLSRNTPTSVITISSHWNASQQLAAAKQAKDFWLASKEKCEWCSCINGRKMLHRLSECFSAMEWTTVKNTTMRAGQPAEGTSWIWNLWSLYGLSLGSLPSPSPTFSPSSLSSSQPSPENEKSEKNLLNLQLYAVYAKRLNKDPVLSPLLQAITALTQQQ